ncbi:hypothetical protein HHL23_11325 [Chryseobacterium sp. RP-3-3]|uniref:Transposase n=1 Tax=Chryseobacterium antibioticum TaxID=2728847 RepID=A0A7Y0AN74_9FLAO|nr:hypothetical protein [Chryseobacterium antibioticum]NML70390.1 hypothetical protein [Chryseobacterium antibioticum]
MTTVEQLYETLDQRRRPEDVAEMIAELLEDQLIKHEHSILEKAAKCSLKRSVFKVKNHKN